LLISVPNQANYDKNIGKTDDDGAAEDWGFRMQLNFFPKFGANKLKIQ